ncbi:hypothetical protein BASA81_002634 [Batrachochytrium salamandrivorans]|nr:hypothetical protein BASA81_002634 [Batrachochytrium salamandrivorans]
MMFPRLTVDPERKSVRVISYGDGLVVSYKGNYFPHRFAVLTTVHNVDLVGTLIITPELMPTYQFHVGDVFGETKKTPTGALDSIAKELGLPKYRKGTNGCLHFGITYEIPQEAVCQARGLPKLQEFDACPRVVLAENHLPVFEHEDDLFEHIDLLEHIDLSEHIDNNDGDDYLGNRRPKAARLCEDVNFAPLGDPLPGANSGELAFNENGLDFDKIPSLWEVNDMGFY